MIWLIAKLICAFLILVIFFGIQFMLAWGRKMDPRTSLVRGMRCFWIGHERQIHQKLSREISRSICSHCGGDWERESFMGHTAYRPWTPDTEEYYTMIGVRMRPKDNAPNVSPGKVLRN